MDDILVVNAAYVWRVTLTKNAATWDLSAATVKLLLYPPGETTADEYSMSGNASGVCTYTGTGAELDRAGRWTLALKVTESGVVRYTRPVQVTVTALR